MDAVERNIVLFGDKISGNGRAKFAQRCVAGKIREGVFEVQRRGIVKFAGKLVQPCLEACFLGWISFRVSLEAAVSVGTTAIIPKRPENPCDQPRFGDCDKPSQRVAFAGAFDLKALLKDVNIEFLLEPFGHGGDREIENIAAAAVKYSVKEFSLSGWQTVLAAHNPERLKVRFCVRLRHC